MSVASLNNKNQKNPVKHRCIFASLAGQSYTVSLSVVLHEAGLCCLLFPIKLAADSS